MPATPGHIDESPFRPGLRCRPHPALRRRLCQAGVGGHRPRHADQGHGALFRHGVPRVRSATSPSPGTERRTCGRCTTSTCFRRGTSSWLRPRPATSCIPVNRHVIVTPDKVEVIAPVTPRPGAKPTQAWDDDDSVPSQAQRSVPLQGWAVANRHDSSYTPVGIRHGSHPAGASTGGDDDAARRVWGEVRERQVTVRWVYMPAE